MVSVSEAASIILSHPFQPKKEKVSLIRSHGRILASTVFADRDFPPFNRVTMDGIAVLTLDFQRGTRDFPIVGMQVAGTAQMKRNPENSCIEVMTGAVLPDSTDTVVRYEDVEILDGVAHVKLETLTRGENIHPRGKDCTENSILLSPGKKISPAEIALMASVGMEEVEVFGFPATAIIATGDELVALHRTPQPYQIRLSNVFALQASLHELGCVANLFHLRDDEEALATNLRTILNEHQLIILSGGVSKGKKDFVPATLESLGIRKLFYQVSQKPGKPFWFGHDDHHTVFALPGNPVSTYLCFYRYILPWLTKGMGADHEFPTVVLAQGFAFEPELTCFLQVKIQNEKGRLHAYPVPGGGSGDFSNLKDVDGFLELPAYRQNFMGGEVFPFIPFRQMV
jgi:molybdopterin molybdotransferase